MISFSNFLETQFSLRHRKREMLHLTPVTPPWRTKQMEAENWWNRSPFIGTEKAKSKTENKWKDIVNESRRWLGKERYRKSSMKVVPDRDRCCRERCRERAWRICGRGRTWSLRAYHGYTRLPSLIVAQRERERERVAFETGVEKVWKRGGGMPRQNALIAECEGLKGWV